MNRTQNELAAALGVDQATVSRRLKKAIEQLRQQMARRGIGLTVAAIVAALTDRGSASSIPTSLSNRPAEISITEGSDKSFSNGTLAWLPAFKLTLGTLVAALVVVTALLIRSFSANLTGPTSSVVSFTRPLPMTTVVELTRLDYGKAISTSAVSMNNRGQVAFFNDYPEEQAGVYVIGGSGVQRLRRLPKHTRRSLTIGEGTFVVVNYDGNVAVMYSNAIRLLTEAADVDIPPSINRKGLVVFVETAPVSRIRLAGSDDMYTLFEAGQQFTRFGQTCINDQNQLAFMADTEHGTTGLFLSIDGELEVIAASALRSCVWRPRGSYSLIDALRICRR